MPSLVIRQSRLRVFVGLFGGITLADLLTRYVARCQRGAERELPDMTKKICAPCGFPTPKLTRGRELETISNKGDDERTNR